MVASHVCGSCQGVDMTALGLGRSEPDHCYGQSERPAPPGVLGGYRCSCPCRDWDRENIPATLGDTPGANGSRPDSTVTPPSDGGRL